jgi:acetyl-CoA carboxylase biotin carboxyl carrier protein
MTLEEIKQILDLVRQHELSEFELERDGLKLRIRKGSAGPVVVAPAVAQPAPAAPAPTLPERPAGEARPVAPAPAAPASGELAEAEAVDLAVVKSPIVGTFYRAPEPGAPPFVEVGSRVRKGQVLCIIEAMKLMNEIESEYDGEVVAIYVENGQPVQYGERLFAIKVG